MDQVLNQRIFMTLEIPSFRFTENFIINGALYLRLGILIDIILKKQKMCFLSYGICFVMGGKLSAPI